MKPVAGLPTATPPIISSVRRLLSAVCPPFFRLSAVHYLPAVCRLVRRLPSCPPSAVLSAVRRLVRRPPSIE
ncbi:MAG: hypothetical protein FWG40_10475 [Peptococcaceae bacterium]|nr:hypothetical protein [Peptococcaceae bacterium]